MDILVLGGDLKNYYLYKKLQREGLNVTLYGFDLLPRKPRRKAPVFSKYSMIIVPIPLSIDSLNLYTPYSENTISIHDLLIKSSDKTRIIGGPFNFEDERFWDITKEESFIELNVIPTCEEIIKILIDKTDFTIMGSCITLYGYGKISKRLSQLLDGMGAYTHIKSNNKNIDKPNSTISSKDNINRSDVIITTSSKLIVDKEIINEVKTGTIIIDVASTDGGIDYKYAKLRNIDVIKARGLPGKSAPLTVSEYIFNTLKRNNLIPIDNKH